MQANSFTRRDDNKLIEISIYMIDIWDYSSAKVKAYQRIGNFAIHDSVNESCTQFLQAGLAKRLSGVIGIRIAVDWMFALMYFKSAQLLSTA